MEGLELHQVEAELETVAELQLAVKGEKKGHRVCKLSAKDHCLLSFFLETAGFFN